jgi:DNA-binding NarL/FixJ family response regulator
MISSQKIISILIVDSHPMIRHGITKMLMSKIGSYQFRILEAEDGPEALSKVQCSPLDIVILDYLLPENNGAQVAKEILRLQDGIRVLVMSDSSELLHVIQARNSGASGYILKNIQTAELLSAVSEILNGKHYYSALVANKILHENNAIQKGGCTHFRKISPREHAVLKLVVLGKTNKEIADELYIGERTVETHRKNLMCKLQVRNTAALIRAGYENQLLP